MKKKSFLKKRLRHTSTLLLFRFSRCFLTVLYHTGGPYSLGALFVNDADEIVDSLLKTDTALLCPRWITRAWSTAGKKYSYPHVIIYL